MMLDRWFYAHEVPVEEVVEAAGGLIHLQLGAQNIHEAVKVLEHTLATEVRPKWQNLYAMVVVPTRWELYTWCQANFTAAWLRA